MLVPNGHRNAASKIASRAQKYQAESDRLVARRLEAIVKEAQRGIPRAGRPEPDCRERYLRWLLGGPDQRYYPLCVWGTFGPNAADCEPEPQTSQGLR